MQRGIFVFCLLGEAAVGPAGVMVGKFGTGELRQRAARLGPGAVLRFGRNRAVIDAFHAARHQPVQLEQHALAARHRLAARALDAAELAVGEAVFLGLRQDALVFLDRRHVLREALRVVEQLGEARDVIAVKRIGVQVAADHDRRIGRERAADLVIDDRHLRRAALAVRAVLQMNADRADLAAADVDRADDGDTCADALLAVVVPVVLLGHMDDLRPADGPAGEQGVAVEALVVLGIYQLDKLQTVGVIHADGFRDFVGNVAVARADRAVIQLVGVDDVHVFEVGTHIEKVDGFVKRLAALDVEYYVAQRFGHLGGRIHEVVHLALLILRDFFHDLELAECRDEITEFDAFFVGQGFHLLHAFHINGGYLRNFICGRIWGQPAGMLDSAGCSI